MTRVGVYVAAIVALASGVAGAAAPDRSRRLEAAGCSMQHVALCPTTNVLIWQKGFDKAVGRFLGKASKDRVGYLYRGALYAQMNDVLGGPPDDRRDLSGGGHLFTACRPQSCTEKGAIAFDPNGKIVAVAVLSFHCGMGAKPCSDNPFLDIYIRDDRQSSIARRAIGDWAKSVTVDDAAIVHHQPLGKPILHRLAG